MSRTKAWSASGAALAALATAVAVLVPGAEAEDPASPAVTVDASAAVAEPPPTDAVSVLTTSALADALQANTDAAFTACVRRAGFEVRLPARGGRSSFRPDRTTGYGIAELARTGPDSRAARAERAAGEANQAYARGLPKEQRQVYLELIGAQPPVSPGAAARPTDCQSAAYEAVARPADPALAEVAQRSLRLAAAVEAHPTVTRLDAAWSACMAAAGHAYASPSEPSQGLARQLTQAPTTPDLDLLAASEVQMARTDLACRASTGYDAAYERVLVEVFAQDPISPELLARATGAPGRPAAGGQR